MNEKHRHFLQHPDDDDDHVYQTSTTDNRPSIRLSSTRNLSKAEPDLDATGPQKTKKKIRNISKALRIESRPSSERAENINNPQFIMKSSLFALGSKLKAKEKMGAP